MAIKWTKQDVIKRVQEGMQQPNQPQPADAIKTLIERVRNRQQPYVNNQSTMNNQPRY